MILQGPGWCTASSRAWCAAARRQLVFLGVLLCDCIYIYMIMLLCYMIYMFVFYRIYIYRCNSVFFFSLKGVDRKKSLWSSCGSLQGMMIVRSIPAILRWIASCEVETPKTSKNWIFDKNIFPPKTRNTRSKVRVDLIKPRKLKYFLLLLFSHETKLIHHPQFNGYEFFLVC